MALCASVIPSGAIDLWTFESTALPDMDQISDLSHVSSIKQGQHLLTIVS